MPKQAVSVTLAEENLLWLRGQARASGGRSVSELLDRLVSEARSGGHVHEQSIRSVVGTVGISDSDPSLRGADAAVRSLFPNLRRSRTRTRARTPARTRRTKTGRDRG